MWWVIGIAAGLTLALFVFYVFGALRLRSVAEGAPPGARSILLSAARACAANAVQKLGIVVILLFVGVDEDGVRAHMWWMLLVIVLPVGYIIREARRRSRMRAELDTDSRGFLESLERIPVLPWQRSVRAPKR